MANTEYKLFNWKVDGESGKREIYNWYGEKLDDNELNKLRVGDCVRLILMDSDPNKDGWEKIYFEITKINYYKKGSFNIPRTFFGKAMDTYRLEPEEKLRYVHTGDIISFQKNNIIEIPNWTNNTSLEQENSKIVDNYLDEQRKKDLFN